ncbi:MAG: hypothetical protein U0939_10655 [Pirellulales bacterium]
MKLAILGGDEEVMRVARHAADGGSHAIVAVCASSAWRRRLAPFAPRAVAHDDWESLIATNEVDAVVLGRDREPFDGPDCLRKLVQAAVPILATHPVGDPLLALELDMIRVERHGPLVIQFPGCRHPALPELAEWIATADRSPIGAIDQVVIERALSKRERSDVIFQLTRDVELVRTLIGSVSKVSAMGPAADAEAWGNLSVQLAGAGAVLARWSVEPTSAAISARLTLVGARGRAVLTMPEDDAAWSLEVRRDNGQTSTQTWPDWNSAESALAALEAANNGVEPTPDWPAVCRDLEVADTVELSLRRGRMIELHHGSVTEEDTFKGVMSALGCLLLMVIPFVLVIAAVFDGIQSTREDRGALNRDRTAATAIDAQAAGASRSTSDATGRAGSSATGRHSTESSDDMPAAGGSPTATRRPLWLYLIILPVLLFLALQSLRLVFLGRRPRQAGS